MPDSNVTRRFPPTRLATLPLRAAPQQADWYIDAQGVGDDRNDGKTPATALATLTEWSMRIGQQVIAVAMTVHVLSDLFSDDTPMGPVNVEGGASLQIVGTPVIIDHPTWTSIDAVGTPATNTPWRAKAGIAGTWTDAITAGQRVKVTEAGPNLGAIVWPVLDLGASVARFSWPMTADPTLGPFGQSQSALTLNDAIELQQLPKLSSFALVVNTSGAGVFQIVDCHIEGGSFDAQEGNSEFYGCQLEGAVSTRGGAYVNCGSIAPQAHPTGPAVYIFGGAIIGGLSFAGGGFVVIDQDLMIQGGNVAFFGPAENIIAAVQIFDWTTQGGVQIWQGVQVDTFAFLGTRRVWGSTASVVNAWRVEPGSFAQYDVDTSGLTLTSGGSNVAIGDPAEVGTYADLPLVCSPAPEIHVVAANETNATTVLANSVYLVQRAPPGKTIVLRLILQMTTAIGNGVKIGMTGPAGATGSVIVYSLANATGTAAVFALGAGAAAFTGLTVYQFEVEAIVTVGATAGNITLQFSQNAAVGGVPATLLAQSFEVAQRSAPPDQAAGMILL